MSQLVQLTKQSDLIAELFRLNRERMTRATPRNLDPARLLAIAFNAIAYNTDLLVCTRESLIGGVFESMKLGLTLGGPMQEAWLIPFTNRRKRGDQWESVKDATLIIGYQGYRNLIDRARTVKDLQPRAVHNGMIARVKWVKKYDKDVAELEGFDPGKPDDFDYYYGDEPRIHHKPFNEQPLYKEQLAAVYVVARLAGGGKQMDVLLPAEIEAHRQRSRAKDNGPWVSDYVPMAMKTAIRKIAKYLPKATLEMQRALELDNKADVGESQDFDTAGLSIPLDTPSDPIQPRRLDGLKEQLRQQTPEKPKAGALTDADINFG